jgi:hypothetical protein
MRLDRYHLNISNDFIAFEFVSESPNRKIIKSVRFIKADDNIYNLAFGDKKPDEDDFDDDVVSNNGDKQKVLATVAASVFIFTEKYPEAWVHATGSSNSRTRLYQIGISQNLEELEKYFKIYGLYENKWIPFVKNKPYEAFIVKRK